MAKPVVLPTVTFPTRAAALAFCRDIHTRKYEAKEIVSDSRDDAILRDLVARHPRADEKIGPGVKEFYVDYVSEGDRTHIRHGLKGIWIRDLDGNPRDFSYTTTINQPTEQAIVKEALRNEVATLRELLRDSAFKRGLVTCPRTGETLTTREQAAVIYEDPDWATLTSQFAQSEGGWESLATHTGDGAVQIGRRLRDPEAAARWLTYWHQTAHPVVVSQSAI